jgi:tRNA A-37 threonylcarbamoyl transferase component Bud32
MTQRATQQRAGQGSRPDASAEAAWLLEQAGLTSLEAVFAYQGGQLLSKPHLRQRERIRLSFRDAAGEPVELYLKRYGQQSLPRRLWRLLTGRGRTSRAQTELNNIRRVQACGVSTMQTLAAGEQSDHLGERRSYIIVSAVPGASLEKSFGDYLRRHSLDGPGVDNFNAALMHLMRSLHSAGLVHRDLYACHIFLDDSPGQARLHLIDLARVFAPVRWRLFRWRVKDLAQLRSSMPDEWVRRHWRGFLKEYLGEAQGASLEKFDRAIRKKASAIQRRAARRLRANDAGRPGR